MKCGSPSPISTLSASRLAANEPFGERCGAMLMSRLSKPRKRSCRGRCRDVGPRCRNHDGGLVGTQPFHLSDAIRCLCVVGGPADGADDLCAGRLFVLATDSLCPFADVIGRLGVDRLGKIRGVASATDSSKSYCSGAVFVDDRGGSQRSFLATPSMARGDVILGDCLLFAACPMSLLLQLER